MPRDETGIGESQSERPQAREHKTGRDAAISRPLRPILARNPVDYRESGHDQTI